MVIQHICIDALENKTIDEKKEQCRENYNELKRGLLSYPMENCFKLFYRQMYKDFIFLGIKLACESGDMTFMLNGLFQGNRIGMIRNNCLNTAQDQSGGLVNIILAFAANDLKLVGKSMPVSPGISDNGYYKGHYNMMYAIYWKDQEAGREAEKQLLKFMAKKQSKFDLSFTRYLLALYYEDASEISNCLLELCYTVARSNWVQEEIFFDTLHYKLGRRVALFVHGLYHLAYYSLNETTFTKIQLPEHKTFIKEYEEFNIEHGFPVGSHFIHLDDISQYLEHFIDIEMIPEVGVVKDIHDGKNYLDADSFQEKVFANLKSKKLIDYDESAGKFVFRSIK